MTTPEEELPAEVDKGEVAETPASGTPHKNAMRSIPLQRAAMDLLLGLWRMHDGSFMNLCLDDLEDKQERFQRYCDQVALAAGLRLSFTYGSLLKASSSFTVIDTNSPGMGISFLFLASLTSSIDLVAIVTSVMTSLILTMVHSQEQLQYLVMSGRRALRVPFILFFVATYIFACSFAIEAWINIYGLDTRLTDVTYEQYDDDDVPSAAFSAWLAAAIGWMLPMPFVHAPISMLIARLYQSRDLTVAFDATPAASSEPAWFANPDARELRTYLAEYFKRFGPGCGRFSNPTPGNFQLFVLQRVRAKGHGGLSYIAQRKIEMIFEEKVEELLAEENVKEL